MYRALFRWKQGEREIFLDALRRLLEGRAEILFAYVHGSFLEGQPFHDVDLAVYLDSVKIDEEDMDGFVLSLALELERSLPDLLEGLAQPYPPLDIRALNRAPLGFRYRACQGQLLCSRDEAVRTQWVERTVSCYLDLRPLQRQALKEAMTA